MEQKRLKIDNEMLDNLSIEEIVDLKMEIEDLREKLNHILEVCDEVSKD